MYISKKRLNDIGKITFLVVFIMISAIPICRYYKLHYTAVGYTYGYVIGTTILEEGEHGTELFYIVNGKAIKNISHSNLVKFKKYGDSVIVKYALTDPSIFDIVESIDDLDIVKHEIIPDSVKNQIYYQ